MQRFLQKITFLFLCSILGFIGHAQVVTKAWATLPASGAHPATAIAIDKMGNVFVASYSNDFPAGINSSMVSKITPDGTVTQPWATLASTAGPKSIAIDASGNVYTANNDNTISKVTSAGLVIKAWATLASGAYPNAIAIDASGNVYTANFNNTISKVTSAGGTVTQPWATLASGAGPNAIAIDASGNVYTANGDNTISKVTSAGAVTQPWATLTYVTYPPNPQAIAIDASGNVYTANVNDKTISKVTSDGTLTQAWATLASDAFPKSIAIDASGNVYTANNVNNTISKVTSAGAVTTIWAQLASNARPQSIAIDASGNVYTANGDNTISKVASSSSNANLSSLTTTAGTLSPTFAATTANYTATVANSVSSITVTPTTVEANATIQVRVNGGSYATVASGSASSALGLNVGGNTINVLVTAQDGTTTKTYTLTVIRAAVPPGNALNFSAAGSNYVNFTTSITNLNKANFTLEAWIRTTSVSCGIINCSNGNTAWESGEKVFYLNASGMPTFVGYNNEYIKSTQAVNDGLWHHVAVVWAYTGGESGTPKMYIDGQDKTSSSSNYNAFSDNLGTFSLGMPNYNPGEAPNYFNGSMDEVRIWNVARTATEILNNFNNTISSSTSGLVAYYNFDNGIAGGTNTGVTTLYDQTSNANNGSLNNFSLTTGTSSNWVESYAMVMPTATAATSTTSTGFTSNWTAPSIGTVTNYLLDVSPSSTFASFVSGYNGLSVSGTSQAVTGLTAGTTYYYRVRADKTSVTGQGGNSGTITAATTASTNADLSALTTTAGTLSPTFASATISYTVSVSNATTSVTVTPTTADANATIQVRVNGGSYATVASGSASSALGLNVGSNTVDVLVTAQDGTTIKTYTITVTKLAALDKVNLTSTTQTPGAYSLRKLSTSYTGNAIKVRRSSDNGLQDIGFTTNGDLDTAALKNFVGSDNGFVTIWYDQSGAGNNAVQATTNLQPAIATAGTVLRMNGRPALSFNSSKLVTGNVSGISSQPYALSVVHKFATATGQMLLFSSNATLETNPTAVTYVMYAGASASVGSLDVNTNILSAIYNTTSSSFYKNGNLTNSSFNTGTSVPDYFSIGQRDDAVNAPLTGFMAEFICVGGSFAERASLETNQTNYYRSVNADLSTLTTTAGTLSPTFATATTSYTATVNNATTSITVTPTTADANATIQVRVNGGSYATVASGSASSALGLNVGSNTVDVLVTAQDGTTIKTYTITVTRLLNTLDNVGLGASTPAATAYSLRKLSSSYTGSAIKVRRSSDNGLQDIGFTGNGDLDTAALKTFVGSGSGYVIRLYDQSGNGYDMIQSTIISQPRIVNNGVIERVNKRPAIFFASTNLATIQLTLFQAGTTFVGFAKGNGATPSALITKTGTAAGANLHYPAPFDFTNNDALFYIGNASNATGNSSNLSATTPQAYVGNAIPASIYSFTIPTSGTAYSYLNGTGSGSVNIVSYEDGGNSIRIGNRNDNSVYGDMWASEWVLFPSVLSTINRQTMEAATMAYFRSSDANLTGLSTTAGTLSPTFASATTSYSASVSNATTSITVTPTTADANATIQVRVNGGSYATVASGSASSTLGLNVGSNTIDVLVTAQDGTTTKTYTINIAIAAPAITWTGTTSTNWAVTSNWSSGSLPTVADSVVVPAAPTNQPTIGNSTIASVKSVTVQSGASLTVAPSGALIVANTATGTVTLQQSFIGQRGWRVLANPFSTATNIATTATNNGITIGTTANTASGLTDSRTFSNSTNTWSNVTGTTWAANTPYALFVRGLAGEVTGSAYTGGPTAFTYNVSGTLNGNSVAITPASSTGNFLLVGNPYAAPVNSKALTGQTTNTPYYTYQIAVTGTPRVKAGSWLPVLSSGTTSTIPVLGVIAYQPANTSTFNVTTNDINTGGSLQTGLFGTETVIKNVELVVTDKAGIYQDKCYIRSDANATDKSTDNTDLIKFYNDNVNLYSITPDAQRVAIDARKELSNTIPLGISATAGTYSINVANNNVENATVYLHDKLNNRLTELKTGSSYSFDITTDAATKGENRFELQFLNKATTTTGDNSGGFTAKVLGNVISNSQAIKVQVQNANNAVIQVKDLSGKTITSQTAVNGINSINISKAALGMYVIQTTDGNHTVTEKVEKQ